MHRKLVLGALMYSSSNLIVYYDKNFEHKQQVHLSLIDNDICFKVFNGLKLVFSALKNPQNYVIIAIDSPSTLHEIENIAHECFDYQNRIFIIFTSPELSDNFFANYCTLNQLNKLTQFIQTNIKNKRLISPTHPSNLLNKLICLELQKLDISTKYIGFKYLVGVIANALSKNFYANSYIDLFTNIASSNLETIDTVERDVRHMLKASWKNNAKLREIFKSNFTTASTPKAKDLLQAIINYLKQVI